MIPIGSLHGVVNRLIKSWKLLCWIAPSQMTIVCCLFSPVVTRMRVMHTDVAAGLIFRNACWQRNFILSVWEFNICFLLGPTCKKMAENTKVAQNTIEKWGTQSKLYFLQQIKWPEIFTLISIVRESKNDNQVSWEIHCSKASIRYEFEGNFF